MISDSLIDKFISEPHIFGHYLGYPDLIGIHTEWINDAWINKKVKAMQAHRNSYKTTSILIVGAIWYTLFFDKNSTNLFIRKSKDEAIKIGTAIKAHYESKNVLFLANYIHNVKTLKTSQWSNSSMKVSINEKIAPEGTVDIIGMGGAITGSHYDNIFPDDIITLKDRISNAEREYTKEYVRELRTNIVKEGGNIFFSGTPWHKDDAWSIIPEPKRYPIGSVNIRGYTKDKLQSKIDTLRESTTSSLYAVNYELKHIHNEDMIFDSPLYLDWPDGIEPVAWIDPAYSGENTTALCLVGKIKIKKSTEKYQWHCRGWVFPENIVDIYNRIVNLLKEHRAGTLYVESNADKGLSAKDLKQIYPSVKPINESMNKHLKIISYGKHHYKKIGFAKDCQPEFMAQILDYQEGEEPDDAPDAFSSLLRQLGFSGHKGLKMEPSKVNLTDLTGW